VAEHLWSALRDPAVVHGMCEDYRAGLSVDRPAGDLAALGRRRPRRGGDPARASPGRAGSPRGREGDTRLPAPLAVAALI
jgi:hypothetical protein